MCRPWIYALAIIGTISAVAPAVAMAAEPGSAASGPPSVTPTHIAPAAAPKMDGTLSDPVWKRAAVIDSFHQISPMPGAKPSKRTEVLLLYDKYALFIGIHCFDDPHKLVAIEKSHDGSAFNGDFVRISLDPLLTRRDGYGFDITPLGGYSDGIVQDNSAFLKDWNPVWIAKARIVSDGWTATLEIPFRDLAYDPHQAVWGLQIIRQIKRNAELDSWAPQSPALNINDLSVAGTITGMSGISEGLGLDIQLYGLAKVARSWGGSPENDTSLQLSGNLYYKVTPSLTATLTANPDFSNAPLSVRQLNTTRFSLFTPETRQFFLQDAAQFQFGGLALTAAPAGPARKMTTHNGEPFFSRTIGIVNGLPVGISGGTKLSGQLAGIQIGALSVRTKSDQGVPAQTLSVERVSFPVVAGSYVGIIGTQGDPTGLSRNDVIGTDFRYLNSDLGAGQALRAAGFYERSSSSVLGTDSAFGASFDFPNEPWSAALDFKQIGTNFAPALGFTNRLGIRRYSAQVNRRIRLRGSYLDWYEYGASSIYVTGLDNALQSRLIGAWIDFFNDVGDQLTMAVLGRAENLPAASTLTGNVPLLAGRYRWTAFHAHLKTSFVRPVAVVLSVNCCQFYAGSYLDTNLTLDYHPNGTFDFNLGDHRLQLRLPSGSATVHALNGTVTVNFTPDMQIAAQLQYDNISDSFDTLVRYNWQYRPGQYLLVAVGEDALINGSLLVPGYRSHVTDFLIRIGHTFQY